MICFVAMISPTRFLITPMSHSSNRRIPRWPTCRMPDVYCKYWIYEHHCPLSFYF